MKYCLLVCLFSGLLACSSGGSGPDTSAQIPGGQQPPVPTPTPDPDPSPAPAPDPVDPPGAVEDFDFPVFESGQVRPLALSVDGTQLYAVNTPDNSLEIFTVDNDGLSHTQSVPVGMEPVAVAVHNSGNVWVVNHLSDSISIVETSAAQASVGRTLLVGDEPRDIVFAGDGFNRAFVTAAHRGQNAPFDPELKTPGTGRADVWVFDTGNLGDDLGGTPLTIVNLFGDTARGLAVTPDGSNVYTAVLNSGNRTTTVFAAVRNGGLDKAPPLANDAGEEAPATGLIVQFDGEEWRDTGDELSNTAPSVWTERIRFSLPDTDVFEIDARAATPVESGSWSGVGTTLFNLAVNPTDNTVYVSNTEARNNIRFEGEGSRGSTVRGNFAQTRITLLGADTVQSRHLNKHISSYSQDLGSTTENQLSVAQVLQMQPSANGAELFAVAFGSSKLIRLNSTELADDSFEPDLATQVRLSGGGPTGVVLDEARNRAYVLTRFDNGVSVVDTQQMTELSHELMHNPEPELVVQGRPFLYDAELSSSRGDSSCAGCHIFADMDHLAWDLGEPEGEVANNPRDYEIDNGNSIRFFHPMKGPMTTQSLRGMQGNGPMHWRGDRTGASRTDGETLEEQAFEDFNSAFVGLLGRETELSEEQMDLFARFALKITYPPNPIRNLDNSLNPNQADGENTFFNVGSTGGGILRCNRCHVVDVNENRFGTSGLMSVEGSNVSEDFKIPHLRNAYQKVGMFGSTNDPSVDRPFTGPQIRGFGFLHDGSIDTLTTFFAGGGEDVGINGAGFVFDTDEARENVIDFVFAMDSDLAPIVGQQVTVSAANASSATVSARLDLLIERAEVTVPRAECDLIAKGIIDGERRGALLNSEGQFRTDREAEAARSVDQLITVARQAGNSLTFTCAPPGQGLRMALDRDSDGALDSDERDAGSRADDRDSVPG
ncbi:MAG: YncE family protein [Pseudomonadales bacterium]